MASDLPPPARPPPSRRAILGWLGAAGASACRRERHPLRREAAPAGPAAPAGRVLSPEDWAIADAATARILPSDDGPGAREARVVAFLDRQLADRRMADQAALALHGLRLLDGTARARHRRPFPGLAPDEQDALLGALARGELGASGPQAEAFRCLYTLTLEGFLSDPIHGGNADGAGWRYLASRGPGGHGR